MTSFRTSLAAAATLLFLNAPGEAQTASEAQHVINLADVEISALIDDIAMLTGYTFTVHPEVNGRVTVYSQTALSTDDLFQVFLSTLRVQGFTAVPDGRGIYRIVPEDEAAAEGSLGRGNQAGFVTRVYGLDHFSSVEAAKMVKPLLSAQGRVVANPLSNVLIVVEYGSNLDVVETLLSQVDQDRSVTQTIALKNIPVSEMQDILSTIEASGDQVGPGAQSLSAVASATSNSIILRGEPAAVSRAARLIADVDTSSPLRKDTRVLTLSHADAVLMEPILRQIAEAESAQAGESGVPTIISVHEPTNSIIVSAAPDTLSSIETIVSQLDARRRQVLVEAIIVEVSDTTARELGLQFLVSGSDGDVPFVSSTFSDAAPNLLALAGALAQPDLGAGDGTSSLFEQAATASLLGLTGGTVGFGGQSGNTLFGVVLNALETDEESNILSTPSIMTLDNNTSRISVGQEIPITAGEVLGDANVNPFRTVERREVGIILSVTPRVGEDGTVRLDIEQEVSSIDSAIGTAATPDFILDQRELSTSVIVDDGELVVLGGLIEASDTIDRDKLPLLGDIPGVGRLFQNEQIGRTTTNLMVFIRPTIIGSNEDARAATQRNYNFIREQQIAASEGRSVLLDEFVEDLLQATPPGGSLTVRDGDEGNE